MQRPLRDLWPLAAPVGNAQNRRGRRVAIWHLEKISLSIQPLLKKPDNSDRQKWRFHSDWYGGIADLMNIAPYLNRSAGLGLRDGFRLEWTEAALVRNFSTTEQLWHSNASGHRDSIPD